MDLVDTFGLGFGFLFCAAVTGLCNYVRGKGGRTNAWPKRNAKIVASQVVARIDSERMTSYVSGIRLLTDARTVR